MNPHFFKFPSTPHLAVLGPNNIRDDKVLGQQEQAEFLQHPLVVEEKIDGANLGISFDAAGELLLQNRGKYVSSPYMGQWKRLGVWLAPQQTRLFSVLSDQYILFGEWCYACHSVAYDSLPDWFLGFDIYDKKQGRFLSSGGRDELLSALSMPSVPVLANGSFTLWSLTEMLSKVSQFANHPVEGIYLRYDDGLWLGGRAKLVRSEFIQAIEEHWSRRSITPNHLRIASEIPR